MHSVILSENDAIFGHSCTYKKIENKSLTKRMLNMYNILGTGCGAGVGCWDTPGCGARVVNGAGVGGVPVPVTTAWGAFV